MPRPTGRTGYKYISEFVNKEGRTAYRFRFDKKHIIESYDLEYLVKYRNEWLCKKLGLVNDYTGGVKL